MRKISTEMPLELGLKTRSSIQIPVDIKRKFLRIWQTMAVNLKTFFISGSSGLGKSRFGKRSGQEELTSLTARVSIQFILPNGKRWKDIWFTDSEYKVQDGTFDDIDVQTSFDLEFLNVFDKDNIAKISSRYNKQSNRLPRSKANARAWFHYASTKASKIRN